MYLNNAIRLCRIVGLIVTIIGATEAAADVRIRQLFETDAFEIMGRVMPATLDTNTIWLSGNNARLDAGHTASTILLGDSGRLIQLDHIDRTYLEIDLKAMGKYVDLKLPEMLGTMSPETQKIVGGMNTEIKVTPTEDKKKIGDWNCRKFILEKHVGVMESSTEVWATTDVEVNAGAYYKIINSLMFWMPSYEKNLAQFSKIDGLTVKEETTARVMGKEAHSVMKVIDIHKEDAPKDAFTIPEGYTEIPMQLPGTH